MPRESPLRVFFPSAADVLVDGDGNGEGIIASSLLRQLAARGHSVTACVGEDRHGSRDNLSICTTDRAGDSLAFRPFVRARRARKAFHDQGGAAAFDVVHWLFPNRAPGLDPRPYAPLPVIAGPISSDWSGARRWWPVGFTIRRGLQPFIAMRQRRLAHDAAALVVVEPGARLTLRPTRAPVVEIPFGLDLGPFVPSTAPASRFTVVYLGRFDEARGVRELIEAARLAASSVPGLRVLLVGDGVLRPELESAAAEAELRDVVEVRGPADRAAVPELLGQASCLCMPSWGEPFGMAVVEAMAAARPVIATNAGALPSLVEDGRGGVLVEPKDARGLAQAISSLAADRPAAAQMGLHNREVAERRYALNVVVDAWEALYRRVTTSASSDSRRP